MVSVYMVLGYVEYMVLGYVEYMVQRYVEYIVQRYVEYMVLGHVEYMVLGHVEYMVQRCVEYMVLEYVEYMVLGYVGGGTGVSISMPSNKSFLHGFAVKKIRQCKILTKAPSNRGGYCSWRNQVVQSFHDLFLQELESFRWQKNRERKWK